MLTKKQKQNKLYRKTAIKLVEKSLSVLQPPPNITTAEWADKHRVLTSGTSAEPGQWETDRIPYLKQIMDAIDDPMVWKVVLKMGVQLGKTEVILNHIGKSIHLDPGPMMFCFPDEKSAEDFSKDRILPLIENSKPLQELVFGRRGGKGKDSTITTKRFPGGYVVSVSSHIPVQLSSRPIKYLYMDESDRFARSAGKEGPPAELAEKRTTNFWNRKVINSSSPGLDEYSPISEDYETSDKRRLYCPCPECKEEQTIEWEQVSWKKEKQSDGNLVQYPETATLTCIHCGVMLDNNGRIAMVRAGQFRATAPFNGVAGFSESSLISLMTDLKTIVSEFIKAENNPEKLKVFWNTRLARTWKDVGLSVDQDPLMERRETYPAEIPDGVCVLTMGVDIQSDRIEYEVKGWGKDEYSWGIEYTKLIGSPKEPFVWESLSKAIQRTYKNQHGVQFRISATCVDSGYLTQSVYDFCRNHLLLNVFPIKGVNRDGTPLIPSNEIVQSLKRNKFRSPVLIGTAEAKTLIYYRLSLTEKKHGFYHFPKKFDADYFSQLTSEQEIIKDNKRVWTVKDNRRNEVLDINVYALAALKMCNVNWDNLIKRIQVASGKTNQTPAPKRKRIIRRKKQD